MKEKNMTEEILDIYDENMNHIGTALRSQVHKEGLWHKAFHCWIVRDNKVLFQLRSKNKDNHPNELDISAAGHLSTGEEPRDGIREIEEELGLKVNFDKLTKLFTISQVSERENYINHEFNPTYLLESDVNLSSLKLQPEEVDGIYEASTDDVIKLFLGEVQSIPMNGYRRQDDNTLEESHIRAKRKDFVTHGSEYYIKVMNCIKRHFAGIN